MKVLWVKRYRGKWQVLSDEYADGDADLSALQKFIQLDNDVTIEFVVLIADKGSYGYDNPPEVAKHLQDLDDTDLDDLA